MPAAELRMFPLPTPITSAIPRRFPLGGIPVGGAGLA